MSMLPLASPRDWDSDIDILEKSHQVFDNRLTVEPV